MSLVPSGWQADRLPAHCWTKRFEQAGALLLRSRIWTTTAAALPRSLLTEKCCDSSREQGTTRSRLRCSSNSRPYDACNFWMVAHESMLGTIDVVNEVAVNERA